MEHFRMYFTNYQSTSQQDVHRLVISKFFVVLISFRKVSNIKISIFSLKNIPS